MNGILSCRHCTLVTYITGTFGGHMSSQKVFLHMSAGLLAVVLMDVTKEHYSTHGKIHAV